MNRNLWNLSTTISENWISSNHAKIMNEFFSLSLQTNPSLKEKNNWLLTKKHSSFTPGKKMQCVWKCVCNQYISEKSMVCPDGGHGLPLTTEKIGSRSVFIQKWIKFLGLTFKERIKEFQSTNQKCFYFEIEVYFYKPTYNDLRQRNLIF